MQKILDLKKGIEKLKDCNADLLEALKKIENITACDDPCGEFGSKQIDTWHLAKQAISKSKEQ